MSDAREAARRLGAVRTALFAPADHPRRRVRAGASRADAAILDLEDSVLPAAKAHARAALGEALDASPPSQVAIVRVNAPETAEGQRDLEAVAALPVDAVMVPKADPHAVALAAAAERPLVALVETARGLLDVDETARHPAVALLAFGPVDLAAELGCERTLEGEELLFARSRIVVAAAAADLPSPLDGPWLTMGDVEGLRREADAGRRLGFGGKLCIHPEQVEPVEACFTPGAAEVARARKVLRAFEDARETGAGVAVVDGEMIDLPVVKRARRILLRAREEVVA